MGALLDRTARVALAALALGTAGCLSGSWSRVGIQSEPDAGVYDALVVGEADLTETLDALGAPLLVQELGRGAVMAWGWSKARNLGAALSIPVTDVFSASFSYNAITQDLYGIVCFYDPHWTLVEKRRGYLLDLLPAERKRPQLVPQDGHGGGDGDADGSGG